MTSATLRSKHAALISVFTERSRRVWAATEARALGYGGITQVAQATGISASTIRRGLRELDADAPLPPERTRRAGGGRKRTTALDPTLLHDLEALVEPTAPGDPGSPLRWTCLSTRTLAVALEAPGHAISSAHETQPGRLLNFSQRVGRSLLTITITHPGVLRPFGKLGQPARNWRAQTDS